MAKKNDKKINEIEETCNVKEITSCETLNNSKLSNFTLFDLLNYEKACYLLCNKYEKDALILMSDNISDNEVSNAKYKLYKDVYNDIFNEIEKRITQICD